MNNYVSAIFIRDLSSESVRAEAVLKSKNIRFTEIFSELDENGPILLVSGSNYQYNGFKEIEDYSESANNC